ncbi:MAG: hypothetical protein ACR2K0_07230 [Acidimicrobiales bacterium]
MGRASSRKKAARAERAAAPSRKRRWRSAAPVIAIVGVVAVGVAAVVYVGGDSSPAGAAPTTEDHWHAAYGFSLCGEVRRPLADDGQDTSGIHTHGDGLIHIHPFGERFTGDAANLGAFADQIGLVLSDDRLEFPDGTTFTNGDDCADSSGMVQVKVWDGLDDTEGRLLDDGFTDYALADDDLVTIAFAPAGADLEIPGSAGTVPDDLDGAEPVGGSTS